ncbi:MAG: hypothetical protein PHY88_00765 [Candidatus Omnitrophica bacterium]|nr:hypothetical protein [Candidatus Omnitrophota bacterium]
MTGQLRNLGLKANLGILLKVILGLFFLILGAIAILKWWDSLLMVVKGCVGLFLILSGIITLAIAKE